MAANAVNSALENTEYGEKIAPYVEMVAAGGEFMAANQDIIQDGVNKFVNVSKHATAVMDVGLIIANSVYGFDKPNNKDRYAKIDHNSNVKSQEVYKSIVSILKIPEHLRERNIFATSEVLDSEHVKNKDGSYPHEINFIKQQISGIDPTNIDKVNNTFVVFIPNCICSNYKLVIGYFHPSQCLNYKWVAMLAKFLKVITIQPTLSVIVHGCITGLV